MTQQQATLLAIALFAVFGGIGRWLFLQPGKAVHDWLWKRLPDGWLRRVLLRRVG